MNYLTYRDILEGYEDVGSIRQGKLLRIYLHIPSLPRLRTIRASLVDLKRTLRRRNGSLVRISNGE